MIEHRDLRKELEVLLLIIVIVGAVMYGGFKAYPLVAGPKISIDSPKDDEMVASTTFQITGKVTRVKEITLQGRPIAIDLEGKFNELLTADHPYTIIILTATDFYGKTIVKTLRVIPR